MLVMDIYSQLKEAFLLPIDYFLVSGKRTYILYLFTSFLLAVFVYIKSKQRRGVFHYILNKNVWLSTSSVTDYLLLILNGFVKVFLVAPFIFVGIYSQNLVNDLLLSSFGQFDYDISPTAIVLTYTITIWLIGDLASFLLHYLMHKFQFLWEFHKVHHSATVLNPFTQYRIHPVELLMINIKGFLVYGIVTGFFFYFSGGHVGTLTFIGVNVFKFVFLFFGANLRHSHVKLTFFNWLEYWLISPFQHQIHHSDNEKHFNKNLGSQLAIWDRLFGTLMRSNQVEEIKFGLGDKENKELSNFGRNIVVPFKKLFKKPTAK